MWQDRHFWVSILLQLCNTMRCQQRKTKEIYGKGYHELTLTTVHVPGDQILQDPTGEELGSYDYRIIKKTLFLKKKKQPSFKYKNHIL